MRAIPTTPPRYEEIADDLRQAIVDGDLAPGSKLPALARLAETYGVAPATVVRATDILQREGLLASLPGSGMFVRHAPEVIRMVRSWYQNPGTGSPWRAAMAELGHEGGWSHDSAATAATPAVAARLGIAAGDRVMCTRYTYTLDRRPAFLATSWEPLATTGDTPVMLPEAGPYAGRGVRDRMEIIGLKPTHSVEENYARPLTRAEADRLDALPGSPVLVVERTYRRGEERLETADVVFPPSIHAVYEIPVD